VWKESSQSMSNRKKTYDLALDLVTREAEASSPALHVEPATVRVYERLRRQLGGPVGVDGFQAIASRALALAKAESPRLSSVQINANGGLHGLGAVESQTDADENGEAGILLIAQLLGLFLTFLGEATTLSLLEDLRLQAEVTSEPETTQKIENSAAAEEALRAEVFDDLLEEIDQLRSVGEHIEALAAMHPGMEDGLVNVAGSIRNIATVLDVFTLIRSRAGDPEDELLDLKTNSYMN
jgi:hypothetical protein